VPALQRQTVCGPGPGHRYRSSAPVIGVGVGHRLRDYKHVGSYPSSVPDAWAGSGSAQCNRWTSPRKRGHTSSAQRVITRSTSFLRMVSTDFERCPELGVLAILLSILDVVYIALLAANRDLLDEGRPSWSPLSPTAPAADTILRQIDRMRRAVAVYQHAALPPPPAPEPTDDDIPF